MTVQPGKDRTASWWLPVVVAAWALCFATIATVYLIGFARGNVTVQRSAAWGMAIGLAAGLVAFPAVAVRDDDTRPVRSTVPLPGLLIGLVLLASVAVAWVALNLAVADQASGVLAVTLPTTASAIAAVLVNRQRRKHAEPATENVEAAPEPPAVAPSTTRAPGHTRKATARIRKTGRAGSGTGLINHAAVTRALRTEAAVALDTGFWRAAHAELSKHHKEQGGVALVLRVGNRVLVLGAIFPAQLSATTVHCEFSTIDIHRVRRALDKVADRLRIEPGEVTVTWVHTHPRLGVFLSSTDHDTTNRWRGLDPHFTPIVIDAWGEDLADQIAVFGAQNGKLAPIAAANGIVNRSAAPRLVGALNQVYQDDGQPVPLILMAG